MLKGVFIVVIGLSLASFAAAEPSDLPRDSWTIEQLIDSLTDPDSTVRTTASLRLARRGMEARPQLLRAARSDDPEQRAQAAMILKKLPWWTADDPPDVRALLERYGDAGETGRIHLIRRLDDINAIRVLLRVITEEPSDTVRWSIVAQLWNEGDPTTQRLIRELEPDDNDPPALLLAGRSWLERDRRKALALLRRAIEADEARPSNDGGILGFAIERVAEDLIAHGDYDEAAAMLRRQVPRDISPRRPTRVAESLSSNLAKLLALHEHFGPLDRCAWDLRTWDAAPVRPASTFDSVVRLFDSLGHAPPLPTGLTSGLGAEERFNAAAFLARLELTTAAELELRGALAMARPQQDLLDANILFLLAGIVGQRADDFAVADLLERAMEIKSRNDFTMSERTDDDVYAELHWRRARAAHTAGDTDAAGTHIAKLLQFTPSNTDSAINMINWLTDVGRTQEAKTLFDKIYQQSQSQMESSPLKAGPQNDLAWLCARTNQRLEEALQLATAAVEEQPDNASFLDTLAECHFRLGHRDEAIRLETRALELSPESQFMREQLDRFRSGAP